jgi:hypothetical protein
MILGRESVGVAQQFRVGQHFGIGCRLDHLSRVAEFS